MDKKSDATPPKPAAIADAPGWAAHEVGRTWREDAPPEDGSYILGAVTYRYKAYKPDGQRQMRAKGRWQRAVGMYGKWENCDRPERWLPAGSLLTPTAVEAERAESPIARWGISPEAIAEIQKMEADQKAAFARWLYGNGFVS